jgi:competence protein ComEC
MGADFLSPFLAGLFNETQWLVATLMLGITDRGAQVPGGNFYAAQPAVWAVVIFYLAGCAWLFWRNGRRWVECGAVMTLAAWLFWSWAAPVERASVLEVGAGQAVLLERSGGPKILIDAGTMSQARWTVEPFLRARGVNRLDAVIGTHGDATHVGGLLEILRRIPVGELVVSPAKTRSSRHKQLVQTAREMGIPVREAVAGDRLNFRGMELEVLWPKPPFSKRADENSLVLRRGSLVILSDLPAKLEPQVQWPPGAVIVRSGGGEELFGELSPEKTPASVIFSCGDRSRDDLIAEDVMGRLRRAGAGVFVTGRNGAVLLKNREGRWFAEALLPGGIIP